MIMDMILAKNLTYAAVVLFFFGCVWLWLRALFESGLLAVISFFLPVVLIYVAVKYASKSKRPVSVIALGIGLFLTGDGINSYVDHKAFTTPPVDVEVSELLKGNIPDNRHVRVGPHKGGYSQVVIIGSDRVSAFYYPIVEAHSNVIFGDKYTVLVNARNIKSENDLPDTVYAEELTGLISPSMESQVIRNYITHNKQAPKENYIVIEQGGKFSSMNAIVTLFSLGGLFIIFSLVLFAFSFISSKKEPVDEQTLAVCE